MALLRDIRRGNVELVLKKECEFSKIIEEQKAAIINHVVDRESLMK